MKIRVLRKEDRLKSRKAVEQLFDKGQRFSVNPFRVFYIWNGEQTGGVPVSCVQFGVGVSTRNFKKAVDRNRVKRLTREAWRLQKQELQLVLEKTTTRLHVFLVYTARELPAYELVMEKVQVILKKLQKLADENNTQTT